MVKYSMHWTGPIGIEWYKKRGLYSENIELFKDGISLIDAVDTTGVVISYREVITYFSSGTIVCQDDQQRSTQLYVPVMKNTDFIMFTKFLNKLETHSFISLNSIITLYEQENPKITWAKT